VPAKLSSETERRIAALFPPELRSEVSELLIHECGNNLPLLGKLTEIELERFRFAALKLSNGDIDKLNRAIRLAQKDWRDLLVAAGFAERLEAHKHWFPSEAERGDG